MSDIVIPPLVIPARKGYPIEWREVDGQLAAFAQNEAGQLTQATWAPQYGSQLAFLNATPIFEVLYEGTRGGGKTDCLLMDFIQHVGKGYGREWRGIIFRQTYPQLSDIINKTEKWFRQIFPEAKYNKVDHKWTFPDGEELLLRHMKRPDDYWNYHGHAYPWIGWEELCNWPNDQCYKVMMSCCRSTNPNMPRCYRATTNPYGVGHNWVKSRFRLPHARGQVIRDSLKDGVYEPPRVAIHSSVHENEILMHADPDYINKIRASARNPAELAAWLYGSWDIIAGGMFDDLWDSNQHVVPSVPLHRIPKGWKIDRSFDWGSSKPFSVCWWAESNGEPFEYNGHVYGKVRGDLYQIAEWYGWNGTRNEGLRMLAIDIAEGIRDRENDWGISHRTQAGPADASIYDDVNGNCIATDMQKMGVRWQPADKSAGSRKHGWELLRGLMKGAKQPELGGIREQAGIFFMNNCQQTLETLPVLPRSDKDPDDVDTEAEDHIADAIRYRVRKKIRGAKQRTT